MCAVVVAPVPVVGVLDMLPEKCMPSVDEEAAKHLERLWLRTHNDLDGMPPSVTRGQTIKQTVLCILEYQVAPLATPSAPQLTHSARARAAACYPSLLLPTPPF